MLVFIIVASLLPVQQATVQAADVAEWTAVGGAGFTPGTSTRTAIAFDSNDNRVCKVLNDIDGNWAKDDIEKLVAAGVISGYPDNTFRPNQTNPLNSISKGRPIRASLFRSAAAQSWILRSKMPLVMCRIHRPWSQ